MHSVMLLKHCVARTYDTRHTAGVEAGGAKTVGVFVDETAEVITKRSTAAGLSYVQLHGDDARKALPNLPEDTKVIYVLGATPDGVVQTLLPSQVSPDSKRLVSTATTESAISRYN
jgi:phosphoribosylanthranilate isomerase